jgi:hypothetical protein
VISQLEPLRHVPSLFQIWMSALGLCRIPLTRRGEAHCQGRLPTEADMARCLTTQEAFSGAASSAACFYRPWIGAELSRQEASSI